ncbi:type II toxin-antitoxin system RatA family toxin [Haloplanus aerogenes]|uniref:Ribosome-associated toxin RatA of RatAB toxin-antitoxin module n=1 Tax=Haloplanus aerogenes TaxID=660522 RepID=A0A3M0DTD4_9EURY|nr:SRPBCC family protein [Haloplanus aerogenes]AZH25565.1 SRPBCC family protein [Haloplanus aerogenes]RMB25281.1 ribosome-associated toxin RatA of RatAB toxin-antitoxin module [Haloplanus aerogenes]
MDRIHVSTVVCLPVEEVYEFLVDFPRYARYSEYLTDVRAEGDGSPGTRYHLRFAWWKLSYTAHTEVTEADPPTRLDWRVVKDLDARGNWRVEPLDSVPPGLPADAETACRVHFDVVFDPGSAGDGMLDLPRFVSLDWVVRKVKPILLEEVERVVQRVVADLEGRRREVELVVHEEPGGS